MCKSSYFKYLIAAGCAALLLFAAFPATAQDPPPPDETQLQATLQTDASYTDKMTAFRGLRQVGTAASVPVIAGFLHDPKLSHLARYALEEMPYPEAGDALRASLDGAPVEVLPGILASLGARRDSEAVPLIQPLVTGENADAARAAAAALGRIASEGAVAALMEVQNATNGSRLDVGEALLAAAQRLTGEKNRKPALAIYRALRAKNNPDFVRVGAFYGLAEAAPAKTPERVLKVIQGNDPLYRKLAREVVAETKGKQATLQYAEALPTLPADVQIALLSGLARRNDKTAREAVLSLASGGDPAVQAAAVETLGALGNAMDVPLLASLLVAPDEAVAKAARNSLIRMAGPAVNNAITKALKETEGPVRAQLLGLLDVRIAPQAAPQATKYLRDEAGEVRMAALQVLLQQGSAAEMEPVVKAMKAARAEDEIALAARTLGAIAGRAGEEALPIIQANLADAPEAVKSALADALGRIGGPQALEPVLALLNTADESMQRTALRVLASWPSQDAAPALLDLAKSEDAARHDAGLRGYTRLAQTHPEHDPKNTMMATAMELARTKEEKWMVLSAYGTVNTGPAMDALESQLDDPEVQKEAAMALLKVAEAVGKHGDEGKARARKSAELLKEKGASETIRQQAERLLAQLK